MIIIQREIIDTTAMTEEATVSRTLDLIFSSTELYKEVKNSESSLFQAILSVCTKYGFTEYAQQAYSQPDSRDAISDTAPSYTGNQPEYPFILSNRWEYASKRDGLQETLLVHYAVTTLGFCLEQIESLQQQKPLSFARTQLNIQAQDKAVIEKILKIEYPNHHNHNALTQDLITLVSNEEFWENAYSFSFDGHTSTEALMLAKPELTDIITQLQIQCEEQKRVARFTQNIEKRQHVRWLLASVPHKLYTHIKTYIKNHPETINHGITLSQIRLELPTFYHTYGLTVDNVHRFLYYKAYDNKSPWLAVRYEKDPLKLYLKVLVFIRLFYNPHAKAFKSDEEAQGYYSENTVTAFKSAFQSCVQELGTLSFNDDTIERINNLFTAELGYIKLLQQNTPHS